MIRQSLKIQFIILLALVCLVGTMSIAYAVLSTTLNITGNTEVIASSWNVHFNNIQVNSASVTPTKTPTITDSKTIDFSVVLNKPGDFYKFNVDIVNDGSINAMIDSVIKSPDLTTEQAKYIKYEIEYINGESISSKQLLSSGETKTISILLSYRTDITASDLPSTPTTLNLSIQLNYVQADQTSTEVTTSPKKIKVVNGDLDTVGSEICIGEECFYLISNDGYKATLFAKYNLYVGGKFDGTTWTAYGVEASGMQDSTMLGGISGNGTTVFSNEEYHGEKNNDYIGSLVEKYVNEYKKKLENRKMTISTARLITNNELVELGCSTEQYSCGNTPEWLYTTSYWTQTKSPVENRLWMVLRYPTGVGFGGADYNDNSSCGVRPIIEVPLTEF